MTIFVKFNLFDYFMYIGHTLPEINMHNIKTRHHQLIKYCVKSSTAFVCKKSMFAPLTVEFKKCTMLSDYFPLTEAIDFVCSLKFLNALP